MLVASEGTGGPVKIYEIEDLMALWSKISAKYDRGRSADLTEVEQVIEAVQDTAWCDHISDFQAQVQKRLADADAAKVTTEGYLNGPFTQHSSVAADLRKIAKDWRPIGQRISTVGSDLWTHHQEDQWISEAAQKYRDTLPTQRKALQELQGITSTSSRWASDMSLVNAVIYSNAQDLLWSAAHGFTFPPARAVAGKGYATTVGGTDFQQYNYLARISEALGYFEAFNRWAKQLSNPNSADWAAAAKDWEKTIRETEVMPVNLQPGGRWPQGVASSTPPAAPTGEYDGDIPVSPTNGPSAPLEQQDLNY